MAHNRKVKLTVLKHAEFPEYAGECSPCTNCFCDKMAIGQEFLVDQNGPQGFWHLMGGTFCSEAWAAIGHYVGALLQGAKFGPKHDQTHLIVCCPNGTGPAVFRLELVLSEKG